MISDETIRAALLRVVLGDTDGGLVLDGELPVSEIARLLDEEGVPTVRRLMQQQAAEELDYANREHGTTVAELSPIDRLTCRLVKSEDLVIRAATLRGEW